MATIEMDIRAVKRRHTIPLPCYMSVCTFPLSGLGECRSSELFIDQAACDLAWAFLSLNFDLSFQSVEHQSVQKMTSSHSVLIKLDISAKGNGYK